MTKYYRSDQLVEALQFNGQEMEGGFVNLGTSEASVDTSAFGTLLVAPGYALLEVEKHFGARMPSVIILAPGDWLLTYPDGSKQRLAATTFAGHFAAMPEVTAQTSDGYHTFQELYDHRHALWAVILQNYRSRAFKTRQSKDGRETPGWFIAGLSFPFGQLTYHMPEEWWAKLYSITTLTSNEGYDGHTSADVLKRLSRLNDYMAR